MNTKSDSYLIDKIDDLRLLPLGEGKFCVIANGTANTSVSNTRLCISKEPTIGTNLLLDLVADPGNMPVITPVSAARVFDLRGFMTVTVRGRENEEVRHVPDAKKPGAETAGAGGSGDFSQRHWRLTHFLNHKALEEPVIPGTVLTAFFSARVSGTVRGSGGCNVYGASFVWQPVDSINIYDLSHTLIECQPPEVMAQERRFFAYLLEAREIECEGYTLELRSGPRGGSTGLRFIGEKPAAQK